MNRYGLTTGFYNKNDDFTVEMMIFTVEMMKFVLRMMKFTPKRYALTTGSYGTEPSRRVDCFR